ncbi:hypothetical protein AB1L05_08900 [Cytobacillus horneckiae]|uniref:hypothetical protein n=1 Tax=Cytobacillus horneckiae TaxID=549687 RepID=UPI0039A0B171
MKVKITTHSGNEYLTDVESYDANDLNEKINDQSIITILIGNKIFSRIDIKFVGPVEEIETI